MLCAVNDLPIRPMTADDVPEAAALMDAGGWHGRRPFWEWVHSVPTIRAFVGEVDGRIAATGIGTRNGDVGWVGSIFVNAGLRRRGFGRAITEAVCLDLEAAGCTTLALIASDLGRPVYETMGFRIDAWYQIWEAETTAEREDPPAGRTIRRATAADLDGIAALDRRVTGNDRSGILAGLIDRTWILEGPEQGAPAGFLAQERADGGSVIAPDPDDGRLLLRHLRATGNGRVDRVRAALVRQPSGDVRPEARDLLAHEGWTPAFETPRMLRGPSIPWEPDAIWGILSFAFG